MTSKSTPVLPIFEQDNEDSSQLEVRHASEENAEVEEFVKKYGDVEVNFIDPPNLNPYFTRPYALNYFHNGVLFRTKNERSSGSLELFIDLVYVGVAANLASSAVQEHSWFAAAKYILLFMPAWTIWSSLKEFMNYYFNQDLLQRVFVIWQLALLLIYVNNCEMVDEVQNWGAWRAIVISYALSGITFAVILMFYSFYIKEHRFQMRLYSTSVVIMSSCWFFIFLIPTLGWRAIFALCLFLVEQAVFCISVHPWFKRKMKLEYSTALNIEHEDERFHAFFIIAIGEFLYSICAGSPLASGWNDKLSKGISMLIMAFIFMGIYSNKDGSLKATHSLRRSATTAMLFYYTHFFVIGSLLVVGDSGADLCKLTEVHLEEEEFGVLIYFHSGILIALTGLTVLALLDVDRTDPGIHHLNRYWRVGFRIPVGGLILGLSWAWENKPVKEIMWIDCMLLVLLFVYEFWVMNPLEYFCNLRRLGI
jgi:low temperature requirement protein LtrA